MFLGKDETKRFQVADLGMERPKPLSWRDRRLAPALVGPSTITAAEQRPNKPTPPLLNDAQKRSLLQCYTTGDGEEDTLHPNQIL